MLPGVNIGFYFHDVILICISVFEKIIEMGAGTSAMRCRFLTVPMLFRL